MKNRHPKRVMARKMLNRTERKAHVPVFDSAAWDARKKVIKERVAKRNKKA